MLTQKRIIRCIQTQDWFAAVDLKDAYFHVSIPSTQTVGLRSRVGHSMKLDSVSVVARLTNERAQSMLTCLSSFRGTLSEAPGAYDIRSCSRRSDCFI